MLGPDQPSSPTLEELQDRALVESIDNVPESLENRWDSPYLDGTKPADIPVDPLYYTPQQLEVYDTIDSKTQRELEEAFESSSLTELIGASYSGGFTNKVFDFVGGQGVFKHFEPDPNFKWTAESFADFTRWLPDDYNERIFKANSLEEAEYLRNETEKELDNLVTLGKYGVGGMVGKFLASAADPAFIASIIATRGATVFALGPSIARAFGGVRVAKATQAAHRVAAQTAKRTLEQHRKAGTLPPPINTQETFDFLRGVERFAHKVGNKAGNRVLTDPRTRNVYEKAFYLGTDFAGAHVAHSMFDDQVDATDAYISFLLGAGFGAGLHGISRLRWKLLWNKDPNYGKRLGTGQRQLSRGPNDQGNPFGNGVPRLPSGPRPQSEFSDPLLLEAGPSNFGLPAPNPKNKIPPTRVLIPPAKPDAIPESNNIYIVDGKGNAVLTTKDTVDPRNTLKSWHVLRSFDPKLSFEKAIGKAARLGVPKKELEQLTKFNIPTTITNEQFEALANAQREGVNSPEVLNQRGGDSMFGKNLLKIHRGVAVPATFGYNMMGVGDVMHRTYEMDGRATYNAIHKLEVLRDMLFTPKGIMSIEKDIEYFFKQQIESKGEALGWDNDAQKKLYEGIKTPEEGIERMRKAMKPYVKAWKHLQGVAPVNTASKLIQDLNIALAELRFDDARDILLEIDKGVKEYGGYTAWSRQQNRQAKNVQELIDNFEVQTMNVTTVKYEREDSITRLKDGIFWIPMGAHPEGTFYGEVRDIVYHGTQRGGFTTFDTKNSKMFKKVDEEIKKVAEENFKDGRGFDYFEGSISDKIEKLKSNTSGPDPTAFMGSHFSATPRAANQFYKGLYQDKAGRLDNPNPQVYKARINLKNPKKFLKDSEEFDTWIAEQTVYSPEFFEYFISRFMKDVDLLDVKKNVPIVTEFQKDSAGKDVPSAWEETDNWKYTWYDEIRDQEFEETSLLSFEYIDEYIEDMIGKEVKIPHNLHEGMAYVERLNEPEEVMVWLAAEYRANLNRRFEEFYSNRTLIEARDLGARIREQLQREGYDGVIYKNWQEGGVSYIAFEPEQIILPKSVIPVNNIRELNLGLNNKTHVKIKTGEVIPERMREEWAEEGLTKDELQGVLDKSKVTVFDIETFDLKKSVLEKSYVDYTVMTAIDNAVGMGYKTIQFSNAKEAAEITGKKVDKDLWNIKIPRAIAKYGRHREVKVNKNISKEFGVTWSIEVDPFDVARIQETTNMVVSPYKNAMNIYKNPDSKLGFMQESIKSMTPQEYLSDLTYFSEAAENSAERAFLFEVLKDLDITPELGQKTLKEIATSLGLKGKTDLRSKTKMSEDINKAIRNRTDVSNYQWLDQVSLSPDGRIQLPSSVGEYLPSVINNPKYELMPIPKAKPKMNPTDAKTFVDGLNKTRAAYKEQGKNVDLQVSEVTMAEATEILEEGGTLLATEDGMMGGYIKADGYMGGLFSHPEAGGGAARAFVAEIEKYGGTHAESYATYLEDLYTKLGWKPVARVKFNEAYAPNGWDAPDSILRHKPDVVFYSFEPNKKWNKGEGERVDEYDDAISIAKEQGAAALAVRTEGGGQQPPKKPPVDERPEPSPEPDPEKVEVEPIEPISDSETIALMHNEIPTAGLAALRDVMKIFQSFSNKITNKNAPAVLKFLGHYGIQTLIPPVNKAGNTVPVNHAADHKAEVGFRKDMTQLALDIRESIDKWLLENKHNYSLSQQTTSRPMIDLMTAVGQVRLGIEPDITSPEVLVIAEGFKKLAASNSQMILDAGMSKELLPHENYLPVEWLTHSISEGVRLFSEDSMVKLFGLAISRENLNLTANEATLLARSIVRNIHTRHIDPDYQSTGNVGESSIDFVERYLMQLKASLPPIKGQEQITDKMIQRLLKKLGKDEVKEGFLRPRMKMDYNVSISVKNEQGDIVPISIKDFLNTNALELTMRQNRRLHGLVQLREMYKALDTYRGMPPEGRSDYQDLRRLVIKEATDRGESASEALELLDFGMKAILGMPVDPTNSAAGEVLRLLQSFNLAVFGSSFGISSSAEIGQPIAMTSIKTFLRNVPLLKDMVKTAATGKFDNELLKEMQLLFGLVQPRLGGFSNNTREQQFVFGAVFGDNGLSAANRFVENLGELALRAGGFDIVDGTSRILAGVLIQDYVINSVVKGGIPYSDEQLKQWGLTRDMIYRIVQQMQRHSELTPVNGDDAVTVGRLNPHLWDDVEALSAWRYGLGLAVKRTIHAASRGQYSDKFQGKLGRIFWQFRTFMLSAIEGQLFTAVNTMSAGDKRTIALILTNSFFGGLSYIASIMTRYAGDDEKLEEYLTMEQIAKGMLFRSGWFTLGAPVMDTLMKFTGQQPIFSHGRASGMASDFLTGTPAMAVSNAVAGAIKSMVAPVMNSEYEFSQQDWRHWKTLAPLHNLAGVASVWHHAPNWLDLPKTSKENANK